MYLIASNPKLLSEKDFLTQAKELRKRRFVFWGFTIGTPLLTMFLTRNTYFIIIPTVFGYYLGKHISQSRLLNTLSPNSDLIPKRVSINSFLSHFLLANGIPYTEDTSTYSTRVNKSLGFEDRYHMLENRKYK